MKNKILVCTGSLMQLALFRKMPAPNYKILVRTGTAGTEDSWINKSQVEYNEETSRIQRHVILWI